MKRQRSYGDDMDDDRRRFYDRGPPPPPPPPRRRPADYDGEGFDRRKGFGGGGSGGFYDHRYRESPSPRGYGGERAMHRSESFSGFRREFPKGFRSERDRSRRDGGGGSGSGSGSSAWRRQGGGWRDSEGLDEYRAAPPRRSGASPPTPPLRSPSESSSRRFEGARMEKSRKQSFGNSEMEEGEVAPDPESKARPAAAVEHRKQIESGRAKEKGSEHGEVKRVDSGVRGSLGTHGKGLGGASAAHNVGREEGKSKDGSMIAEAETVTHTTHAKSTPDDVVSIGEGHEVQGQDEFANAVNQVGQCISSGRSHNMLQEETMIQEDANVVDVIGQNTSFNIQQEAVGEKVAIQDETANAADEAGKSISISVQEAAIQEKTTIGYESDNVVDEAGESTSSSNQKEAIQEKAIVRDEIANAVDEGGKCTSSSNLEAIQENVTIRDETSNAVDESGQGTSSSIHQEGLQEEVMALDEAAGVTDTVRKASMGGMHQEVLLEKLGDRTANDVDRVECGTSPGPLQVSLQEGMASLDGIANAVEPEKIDSAALKETIEGELVLDRIANVVVEGSSPSTLEEAMHGKVTMQHGCSSALDIAEKCKQPTITEELVQEKATTSPCQGAPEMKINEKGTMSSKKISEQIEPVLSQHTEEAPQRDQSENRAALVDTEVLKKEAAAEHETIQKEVKGFCLEADSVDANLFLQPSKERNGDSEEERTALNLIIGKPSAEDKGKGIAFDVLNKEENIGVGSSVGRSFDLALPPDSDQKEVLKSSENTSVKQEEETLKIGRLDLSLSLSGGLQNPEFKCSVLRSESLGLATCSQTLPSSSFHTNSEGFTASVSLTNSQTFVHNPSCSLTQQSLDNYEHSVGSKPLFKGVDKVSDSTRWQPQLSNESTRKREPTTILQNTLKYGNLSDKTFVGVNMQNNGISKDIQRRAGISGVSSPTHSRDSHDSGFEQSRHRRQLTRERSSSSLTRGERQDAQQLVLNGAGVIERIVSKIVSEPLHHTGRMLEEMTSNSVTYLREAISDIIVDADKRGQVIALQEALKKRSDLTSEMLQRCPRVLLEILVAIRTGLPDFIKKSNSISACDLVEIFLYLKCRNLSCKSILPVDDCDCKVCKQKTGFCSSCMCTVCSKFDMASNTCSWVGCDVCLHWCHTDCGILHSLIRKGGSGSRAYSSSEMQFHCAACGHPSEMFGFVKEVFRTCAMQWRVETLVRELQYVERIFSSSDDARGKRVRDFVKQMIIKLENRAYHPEVVKYIMAFFSDDDSNIGSDTSAPLKGIPCNITERIDGIASSSRKSPWVPSVTLEGVPFLEKQAVISTTGSPSTLRKFGGTDLQPVDNKPTVDELDGLIRLKQAEANMYQQRANDARKEAETLKHITKAKYAQIEEHYATQITEINMNELQEQRKRKIEELQVIQRKHYQYLSMKTRMEGSIRELLLKMEATKQNFNT
uniref:Protein OBERON 4 n=1 Tax=Leersia perrieri TaxID=77586 RepID=A0A0D9VRA7_9ORYZ